MVGTVKGSKQVRMTVVPYRPWRRAVIATLLTVGALVLGVGAFLTGYHQGAETQTFLETQLGQQQGRNQRAETELAQLREQLAIFQRMRQVDVQADEQAQANVAALTARLNQLERDVGLYRQVMSLPTEKAVLSVLDWELSATELSDRYHYQFTLAVAGSNGEQVTVAPDIQIAGVSGEEESQYSLWDLSVPADTSLTTLSFSYMHRAAGFFSLPEGFLPHEVRISVADTDGVYETTTRSISWQPLEE
tara:strand:- start:5006 stop:5749 length:744 start_codon:yes stop_codon:yes gene_type:complete